MHAQRWQTFSFLKTSWWSSSLLPLAQLQHCVWAKQNVSRSESTCRLWRPLQGLRPVGEAGRRVHMCLQWCECHGQPGVEGAAREEGALSTAWGGQAHVLTLSSQGRRYIFFLGGGGNNLVHLYGQSLLSVILRWNIHINLFTCHYTRIQLSLGTCGGLVPGSLGDTKIRGCSRPSNKMP